jgi:hypothetical protein
VKRKVDPIITDRVLQLLWDKRISMRQMQKDLFWADHRLSSLRHDPRARWTVQELVEAAEYLQVPILDLIRPPVR